jgi:hypothetical protein
MAIMEKKSKVNFKEFLLIGFVTISVMLIFAVWFNSFTDKGVDNPYFYRGIPTESQSLIMTTTAIAQNSLLGTGTPTVVHKHEQPTVTQTPIPTELPLTPQSDG